MNFIWCDSGRHAIVEILTHQTSQYIKIYFLVLSLRVRVNGETIALDLATHYINLFPEPFPNAKVVVDCL
ncbi:transposase [Lactiplantibacillus argentoratensis]|uniref:transposase n=1 Tax=Lactiplantibacillus argentoratensis TaxID=271881 RepID=UPI003D77D8EC